MTTKKIEHNVPRDRAFTLDEVAAFVQDAMRSGASGSEVVTVSASWRMKIQRLTLDVELPAQDPAPLDKP